MKFRGLILAALVLIVLAGFLYWSDHKKATETSKPAETTPVVLKVDEAAITGLTIKKKDEAPVVLARTDSNNWKITQPGSFGADQAIVGSALHYLSSMTSIRVVEDKGSNLKTYGLDPPAAEVNISEKNGQHKVLIGDETPTGGAVYVAVGGDPRVYTVSSFLKTGVVKTLDELRDKRLVTLDTEKLRSVELTRGKEEIEFVENDDQWAIAKPKAMRADQLAVDDLVHKLRDARMELGGTQETSAEFNHLTPVGDAKLTGESSMQEVQVRKSKDANYAKTSVVDGFYKTGPDLGTVMAKSLDGFRNKKLFDFGFTDPQKIEWHSGDKPLTLARSGEDWTADGKKMAADSVQGLVAKLRDLTAAKFVEARFGKPIIDVTVTSDDGKRVEEISVTKVGDGYIAKREDGTTLYQLDSAAVDELRKAAEAVKSEQPAKQAATPAPPAK
jgi:hypothetical protein